MGQSLRGWRGFAAFWSVGCIPRLRDYSRTGPCRGHVPLASCSVDPRGPKVAPRDCGTTQGLPLRGKAFRPGVPLITVDNVNYPSYRYGLSPSILDVMGGAVTSSRPWHGELFRGDALATNRSCKSAEKL
jgi:hypothetical protein